MGLTSCLCPHSACLFFRRALIALERNIAKLERSMNARGEGMQQQQNRYAQYTYSICT